MSANTNITNSALPHETTTTGFLNSWKREASFTGLNPLFDLGFGTSRNNSLLRSPADWLSSQELMDLSGTANEATGTWRRVPYQTTVIIKDSSLFVGEAWEAEDNFVSATNRYGEAVDFDELTVTGTVDTSTAGTYEVTYEYNGVAATARITVKARSGGNGNGNGGAGSNNGNGPSDENNLPRTGEIAGVLGVLGLANLVLALKLWLKRRKTK